MPNFTDAHCQEEIKHILQQAAQSQLRSYRTGGDMAKGGEAVARSQARYTGRTFSDSAELIPSGIDN